MAQRDAVIVGAGHNGLVAAAYLAGRGLDVLVVERRRIIGGACATEELIPGFRFSSCSFLCYALEPTIVRDLDLRGHGLEIYDLDPLEFRPFPDGRHLVLYRDEARNVEAIRAFSELDAAAYPRWNALWARAAAIVDPYRLRTPPTLAELFRRVRGTDDERLLERLLTTGFADLLDETFESEHVKAALVHSGDVGDPRGAGTSWPTVNLAGGAMDAVAEAGNTVGIVRGGMGSISEAIAASAGERGATIRTDAEVRRIVVKGGRAVGVELVSGEEIPSRLVVSNADPKTTFLRLIEPEELPAGFRAAVDRLRTKVSYLKFHAAMRELPDFSRWLARDAPTRTLARIWINPSVAYYEQAWRDAADGRPANQPVMSIQIPSLYDDTISPPGRHVLSIFAMFAPVYPREGSWDELRVQVGEALIDSVSEYAPNFRDAIADWLLFTPVDLERRVGLTDGNIHHLDMIPSQLLGARPLPGWSDYRTPIEGLWLCGAGTHPGGEVSGAPGHNSAQAILATWPALARQAIP